MVPANCTYAIEIFAACSSDLNVALGGLNQAVYSWTNNPDPSPSTGYVYNPSSTIDFEIVDEQFYYIIAAINNPENGESCSIDATINDGAAGVCNITLTDGLLTGTEGINILMLHCDRISYSECWNGDINNPSGGERECCLEF